MKNKNEFKKDYSYIDHLKERKTKPFRLRLQISGVRKNYYFATKEEAEIFKLEQSAFKDKVYKKGDCVHYSLLTLFREWIVEKELSVSSGTIVTLISAFKHLSSLNNSWLIQISKSDCLNLIKNDPSKSLKLALSILSEINKFSLEKYDYGFNWNLDGLVKNFKPKLKSVKKVRSFYTEEEIGLILNHLKKKNLYWFHFFRLGFSLGARIGEICSLKKINYYKSEKLLVIDSTLHSVFIGGKIIIQDSQTTKNGEARGISLGSSAIESIDYFLSLNKNSQNPYLVSRNRKYKSQFMSKGAANFVLKQVSQELGLIYLPSHCAFRKTFATMVAKKSKKTHRDMISAIQKQLGHKSPQMTLYYIQSIELGLDDELSELDKILNKD